MLKENKNDCELVKNHYIQDDGLKLIFEYNKEEYHVEMGRFILSIKNSRDEEYFCTEVYSYYDCITYNNGCVYFGDRFGMVHIISMNERREIFSLFLNDETERYYNNHINMYPHTLPLIIRNHELGDYRYLPELHIMNEVVSTNSVSVLYSWGDYVIFGDISGNISIFDITTFKVIKTLKVGGAVSYITKDEGNVVIDFIRDNHIDSPQSLSDYETAQRIFFDFTDWLSD